MVVYNLGEMNQYALQVDETQNLNKCLTSRVCLPIETLDLMVNSKIEGEIDINPARLEYLLSLYKMNNDGLAREISGKRKPLTGADLGSLVEKKKIPLALLKKIDKIFERGINWYATERKLPEYKSSSIFFRKDKFNTELNFESRKIASRYEEKKFAILNLCSAINFKLDRRMERFSIDSDAKDVAKQMRAQFAKIEQTLYEKQAMKKPKSERDILKLYSAIIEHLNVFVFEYLEAPRKKEKTNFNGFFIQPNIIVIKGQKYYRREIFTLLHEFAHYLLDSEEIDDLDEERMPEHESKIERWCNDFVYYFLAGDYAQTITSITPANAHNGFHKEKVEEIYKATSLSWTSIYTRLKIEHKLSPKDYDAIMQKIYESMNKDMDEKKMRMRQEIERKKEMGMRVQPIFRREIPSRLYKEIVTINYFEGNLNEVRFCDYLNVRPDKIDKELY